MSDYRKALIQAYRVSGKHTPSQEKLDVYCARAQSIVELASKGLSYRAIGDVVKLTGQHVMEVLNMLRLGGMDAPNPAEIRKAARAANPVALYHDDKKTLFAHRQIEKITKQQASRGKSVSIEVSDFLPLPSHCPGTGVELFYAPSTYNPDQATFMLVHPSRGWTKGNVEIVSLRASELISRLNIAAMAQLARYMIRKYPELLNNSQ